jgi:outer membrane receptor protein involved in Fe transport
MHGSIDGDMDQRLGSLDLSAQWRGWQANVRYNRRDYGFYAFTPPFDEGMRIQLDTLQASLGYTHRFSDDLGLKVSGIYSTEHYDAYQLDFLFPKIGGDQRQDSRRIELEAERIQTLEANYTLTRPRGMLSAGLFQNRLSQLVRTIQRVDPETGLYVNVDDNSGRWRTRGLELIAEARPLPGLDLGASLTWQQTEDHATGIDPGYSPALLAKLKASWSRGPMTYGAYAHYVDGMDADWDFVAGPEQGVVKRIGDPVSAYWNVGLNLRWDAAGAGLYADLHVSNLLDTEIRYPANELTDFQRGLIGPGRVVTVTVGYAF